MKIVTIWVRVIVGIFIVSVGWVVCSLPVNMFFDSIDAECRPDLSGVALTTYDVIVSVGKITFNLAPVAIILGLLFWGYAKTQQKERVTEYIRV